MPFLCHSGVSQHSGWAQRGSISVAVGSWKLSNLLRSSSRDLDDHIVNILMAQSQDGFKEWEIVPFFSVKSGKDTSRGNICGGQIFGNTTLMHPLATTVHIFPMCKIYSLLRTPKVSYLYGIRSKSRTLSISFMSN